MKVTSKNVPDWAFPFCGIGINHILNYMSSIDDMTQHNKKNSMLSHFMSTGNLNKTLSNLLKL